MKNIPPHRDIQFEIQVEYTSVHISIEAEGELYFGQHLNPPPTILRKHHTV
jgi:hypothetical protein